VTRRVDENVFSFSEPEEYAGSVDRDPLRLFVLERIHEESILERLRVPLTVGPDLGEFAVGQSVAVGEEAANDGALAVVDVAGQHYVQTVAHKKLGSHKGKRLVDSE